MDMDLKAPKIRTPLTDCLLVMFAAAVGLLILAGCSPPAIGDVPSAAAAQVDAVEVAHQHAKLSEPKPDFWMNMPEDVRRGIVNDSAAEIDPRLSAIEQRLGEVELRGDRQAAMLDKQASATAELSDRVSAIENLPQAPSPDDLLKQLEQLEADRQSLKELEATADRLLEEITTTESAGGGRGNCGRADCPCGPLCDCPAGQCRCQAADFGPQDGPDAGVEILKDKPYASVTLLSVPGCPPCEEWKRDVLPAVLEKGWAFSEETLTHGTAPQFRICIGDACYMHQGPLTGNDLSQIVDRHDQRRAMSLEGPGFFGGPARPLFGRR